MNPKNLEQHDAYEHAAPGIVGIFHALTELGRVVQGLACQCGVDRMPIEQMARRLEDVPRHLADDESAAEAWRLPLLAVMNGMKDMKMALGAIDE